MPAQRRILFVFLISAAIFLFSPKVAFAATFSFSEIPETIDEKTSFTVAVTLGGLTAGNKYYLRAAFSHPDTPTFYFGYTKNNSGVWYGGKPSPIDHTQFFQITINPDNTWNGFFEVKPDPEASAYKGGGVYNFKIGRYTEAGSGPTWSENIAQVTIIASITPTSTSTPTPISPSLQSSSPTPGPPSAKATYKINEVKDESGNSLSSVKIYVNGNYVHHYAPEVLTFCDGCKCDTDVKCGFGEHDIRLEKSGYKDWTDKKTINSRESYEVNPVMTLLSISPSSTLGPTSRLSPTATKMPVSQSTEVAKIGGASAILGETDIGLVSFLATESATLSSTLETPPSKKEATTSSRGGFFPKVFLILGGLAILGMMISLFKIYQKRKNIMI